MVLKPLQALNLDLNLDQTLAPVGRKPPQALNLDQ